MRTHAKTFHIRFTEKEYERLWQYAAKAGLPKTTYIRHMINGVRPKERPPIEFFKMLGELCRIGNNLNQIVKMAHRFDNMHYKSSIETIKQFSQILFKIQQIVMWSGDVEDIPAALERGRQLAEKERKEGANND